MTDVFKVAVLLKPGEIQPALERVAQFAHFMPEMEVTAVRVINEFDDSTKEKIQYQTDIELDNLFKNYQTIKKYNKKIIFNTVVADAFVDFANDSDFNLCVISANKRNTIKDLFISTIDCSIMRSIKVPLIVVKDANAPQRLGKAMLVAIDFEESEHDALLDDILIEKVKMFADKFNGEIHVVNVVSPAHRGVMTPTTSISPMVGLGKDVTRKDLHYILLRAFAKKHNIPEENTHVSIGRIDEEIPRLSKALEARMVCMGTSAKSGLLGSINCNASELVLEQIRGDVFVVNFCEDRYLNK